MIKVFLFSFLTTMFVGCVSIKLPTNTATRDSSVIFVAPQKPFLKTHSDSADEIWQSSKTGNTISFFTSCSSDEPALKGLVSSAIQGIKTLKIEKEEEITFVDQPAIKVSIEGKLENLPTKIQIIVLKKNYCSYHLTYVSTHGTFDEELKYFNKFLEGFNIP